MHAFPVAHIAFTIRASINKTFFRFTENSRKYEGRSKNSLSHYSVTLNKFNIHFKGFFFFLFINEALIFYVADEVMDRFSLQAYDGFPFFLGCFTARVTTD